MKNWYYDLLDELYDKYDITAGTSLENFIKRKLKAKDTLVNTTHIKTMLLDLENRGLITWKADVKTTNQDGVYSYHWLNIEKYKNDLGKTVNGIDQTFSNIYVEAHLTPDKGLDYAADLVNGRAIRNSTLATNFWMTTLTIIIALTSMATLRTQYLQYKSTETKELKDVDAFTNQQIQLDSINLTLKRINATLGRYSGTMLNKSQDDKNMKKE
ncbi:hypothetical protein [Dawidia soli]|uniref:Uncharacterized protein n=1 Tax=Dawidia soli TaxID=2782352 RepID=A0AAP2GJU2_9BACT|nr:hypothetical protein [Dawidia soli]MBT1688865.1 hypothetical protein [Dawidia soli]